MSTTSRSDFHWNREPMDRANDATSDELLSLREENARLRALVARQDAIGAGAAGLLAVILEHSPLGILVVNDRADTLLCHNHRFCAIWGVEYLDGALHRGDLRGSDLIAHLNPKVADLEGFLASCKALQDEENRAVIEDDILFADGRIIRRFSTQLRNQADRYLGRFHAFEDVTERRQAESALAEGERRYRELADSLPQFVFEMDIGGRLTFANRNAFDVWGYTPEEFVAGLYAVGMLAPEDRERGARNIRRVLQGATLNEEYLGQRRDGSTFPISIHAVPIRRGGQTIGLRGIMLDITERKRAEDALKRSEREGQRFRESLLLLHEIRNKLIRCDSVEDLCRRAVEQGRSLLGVDRIGIWFAGEDAGQANGSFGVDENGQLRDERGLSITVGPETAMGRIFRRKERLVRAEGASLSNGQGMIGTGDHASAAIWCGDEVIGVMGMDNLLSAGPLTHPQCDLLALYAATIGHLIARLRAEEALRENEARYRSLYTSMSEGVALHEVIYDGSGRAVDYRIVDVNPAFEALTGLSREQAVGSLASELYGTGEASFLGRYASVAESGEPVVFEVAPEPAGRSFRVSAFRPGPGQFATVFSDVTERRRLEAQLLHAQRIESIGRLAGGVAHDFNNLLTALFGYAQMALLLAPPQGPLRDNLLGIENVGERAASLTRQLLAFARRQVIQPRTLDLNDVLAGMYDLLRRLIGENIDLVTLPAVHLWGVHVDPGQMEQVLANLVVNACDAMPHGGTLTIETANVAVGEADDRRHPEIAPGEYVVVAVRDTGAGIAEAVRSRIFEPFFTTKEQGKGTGLGLATCYGIASQSGGHITVESEVGRGATFRVYLPRVEYACDAPASGKGGSCVPGGTETVLVVEDEPLVRTMVLETLRAKGYQIIEAEDGLHALDVEQRYAGTIHLLVTDVVMPRLGGVELAAHLRRRRPSLRILYTSGYGEKAALDAGSRGEGAGFIHKPFSPTLLARKVREILGEPS